VNSARLACGHPMCDPGSAECRIRDVLAAGPEEVEQLTVDAVAALYRSHGQACTVADPCSECRPAEVFRVDPANPSSAARLLEVLGGRPLYTDRIRTGVDPKWPAGAEVHRSDCETNGYDSGPCDCGTGGLTAETLVLLLGDVRREQARAISEWMRAAPPGVTRERVAETWRRSRPGFARLLDLTDHD